MDPSTFRSDAPAGSDGPCEAGVAVCPRCFAVRPGGAAPCEACEASAAAERARGVSAGTWIVGFVAGLALLPAVCVYATPFLGALTGLSFREGLTRLVLVVEAAWTLVCGVLVGRALRRARRARGGGSGASSRSGAP